MSVDASDRPADPATIVGPSDGQALMPTWVRGNTNLFAMLVTAVVVGIGLFLVSWLAPVLGPFGLGLFLAALAAPLFTRLAERTRSGGLALVLTIGLVVVVGVLLVLLALAGAQSLADGIATYSASLADRYPAAAALDPGALGTVVRSLLRPDFLTAILQLVVQVLIEVAQAFGFAVVVAALLLLDGRRLSRLTAGGLGSENPVFREAPAIARAAVTYFTVRIRVNVVTAVGMLVLMLVLGVDDALLWAVATFFLSFVPYIGLVIAMIPPAILAFAESGPLSAVAVIVGATALNLIAENVLEPTMTGRALSLSTWLVFISFFFWAWLIGPLGALLSMPITVLIVLVLQHNERTQWVAALLSHDGSVEPTG